MLGFGGRHGSAKIQSASNAYSRSFLWDASPRIQRQTSRNLMCMCWGAGRQEKIVFTCQWHERPSNDVTDMFYVLRPVSWKGRHSVHMPRRLSTTAILSFNVTEGFLLRRKSAGNASGVPVLPKTFVAEHACVQPPSHPRGVWHGLLGMRNITSA